MLRFDDIVKVMKERSFFSEFQKMIESAGNKMKEKCIISEEDLKNLHLVYCFGFCYDFQENEIRIYAQTNSSDNSYQKLITLDSEIEEMKKLSDFLENKYTKKLKYFEVSFDKRDKYEGTTNILVLQKKVDKEVWSSTCYNQNEYFDLMFHDLESDLKGIGITCIDISKDEDWSEEFIVD